MEIKRNLLAVFLISIIIMLTPKWLSFFSPQDNIDVDNNITKNIEKIDLTNKAKNIKKKIINKTNSIENHQSKKLIHIETDLFFATISNKSGGSFVYYKLKNFTSGYDINENYNDTLNVELINKNNASDCMPCIIYKNGHSGNIERFNQVFNYDISQPVVYLIIN